MFSVLRGKRMQLPIIFLLVMFVLIIFWMNRSVYKANKSENSDE